MKSIDLPADNFTLKLVSEFPENPRWISVFIQKDREMIRLGADCDYIIYSRKVFTRLKSRLSSTRRNVQDRGRFLYMDNFTFRATYSYLWKKKIERFRDSF